MTNEVSGPKAIFRHARIIAFYMLAFASGGLILPFINIYLVEAGFSATQIGVLRGGSALALVIITPIIGVVADRTQRFRRLLRWSLIGKGIAALLITLHSSFLWLLGVVSLRVISAGAQDALMNRLTLVRLKASNSRDYGSIRFWGGLTFAGTSIFAGWLARNGSVSIAFPMSTLLAFGAVLMVGAFPRRITEEKPVGDIHKPPARSAALYFYFLISFFFVFGRSGTDNFVSVHLVENLDAGNDLVGLVSGIVSLSTLPGFFLADWLIRRKGLQPVLVISFCIFIVYMAGYALIDRAEWALGLAILNGLGEALSRVTFIVLLGEISLAERAATDQMLAQLTVPGLAAMIALPLSGWIFDNLGASVLFSFDAMLLVIPVIYLLLRPGLMEMLPEKRMTE
jgi:MFS family permease